METEPADFEEFDPEELEDVDPDAEEAAVPAEEEDDSDEASLDELLAQRAAGKRDEESEEEDIMALVSEGPEAPAEPLPTRVIPIKDREEFVCASCHLVKARSQLADERRGLCRDCV